MISFVRAFVKNGEKYLFTKNVFMENLNYYFGGMRDLGAAKQST